MKIKADKLAFESENMTKKRDKLLEKTCNESSRGSEIYICTHQFLRSQEGILRYRKAIRWMETKSHKFPISIKFQDSLEDILKLYIIYSSHCMQNFINYWLFFMTTNGIFACILAY